MKFRFSLFFIIMCSSSFGQNLTFTQLLNAGKAEFKKDYVDMDYEKSIQNLEKAIKLKPESAEAHYFLGYAYDKLNTKDAEMITESNLDLIMKSSKAFETVIKLQPKYSGELLFLDPYSKLTSIWSVQAFSYLFAGKSDSAKWAFQEGKKRGGFSDFSLALNRNALLACPQRAILLSSGDIPTYSLAYLQTIEEIRPDVSVVDVSLLETFWYGGYLQKSKIVDFDLSKSTIDSLQSTPTSDSTFTFPLENGSAFRWVSRTIAEQGELRRSERLLLSMLKVNGPNRSICLTKRIDLVLDLADFASEAVFVDRLTTDTKLIPLDSFNEGIKKVYSLIPLLNQNSSDDIENLESIRIMAGLRAEHEAEKNNRAGAKAIITDLNAAISVNKYPFQNKQIMDYLFRFLD